MLSSSRFLVFFLSLSLLVVDFVDAFTFTFRTTTTTTNGSSVRYKCNKQPHALTTILSSSSAPNPISSRPLNVLGGDLRCCCTSPKTGFYRDGYCQTGPLDVGRHTVCARVTAEFLQFSKRRGNDLITPKPEYRFPGLNPGDKWCLCVSRWKEALDMGVAPQVILEATHMKALETVTLDELKAYAIPAPAQKDEL